MAKSGDNFITIDTLIEKGYDPLAYRYFLLQAHYRKQLSFSWEALDAAASGLKNLRKQIARIEDHTEENPHLVIEIIDAVNHDLNTAEALGLLQRALKEKKINKRDIETIDKIFGLDLLTHNETTIEVTPEIQALLNMRAEARDNKDWQRSDDLRDELANMGVNVKDTEQGQIIIS
jgi:cysteinyl-tRNA synthetase